MLLPTTFPRDSSTDGAARVGTGPAARAAGGGGGGRGDVDRMRRELFWEAEQRLIMHKLAKDHFGFRAFWMQSWPLLLTTTFIAIIAFVEYGSVVADAADYGAHRSEARRWLLLLIGLLGLLSTLLTATTIATPYQSRSDAHATAERALFKVCRAVRCPERPPGEEGTKLAEHVRTQEAVFASIVHASPDVPPRIAKAFRDLENAMRAKPYTFRAIQYERFYCSLWKSFANNGAVSLWPWRIPEIDLATSALGKQINEEYEMFNKGMEKAKRRRSSKISAGSEEQVTHVSHSSTAPLSVVAEV